MPGDGDIWRQEHLERGRLGDRDTFLILPPPSFLLHPNGTRGLNNIHPQCFTPKYSWCLPHCPIPHHGHRLYANTTSHCGFIDQKAPVPLPKKEI